MDSLLFHPKLVHIPIALALLMPVVTGGCDAQTGDIGGSGGTVGTGGSMSRTWKEMKSLRGW